MCFFTLLIFSMQDEHKVRELTLEHQIFCITEGIENLCYKDTIWDYNEEALRQSLNLIELCYRKLKNYDAFALTYMYRNHMHRTFWHFYGVEWKKINTC